VQHNYTDTDGVVWEYGAFDEKITFDKFQPMLYNHKCKVCGKTYQDEGFVTCGDSLPAYIHGIYTKKECRIDVLFCSCECGMNYTGEM
jgi:hypothetical protein